MSRPSDTSRHRTTLRPRAPVVLVVAGLDPSAGAGLLADTRVITERGRRALGVATALTEQDSRGCVAVNPVDTELVSRQLERLLADCAAYIGAVKIGVVGNAEIAARVAQLLEPLRAPIILDPVLAPTRSISGARFSDVVALKPLLDLATLITPNHDELAALTTVNPVDRESCWDAAAELCRPGGAVLAKGGHPGCDPVYDLLVIDRQRNAIWESRRIHFGAAEPRGTGCALSTEIAVSYAEGRRGRAAIAVARKRFQARLRHPLRLGKGRPTLG